MRILLNGWFLVRHPHTGSGQYLRHLLEWLPRIAPENEYHVFLPDTEYAIRNTLAGVALHSSPVTSSSDWSKLRFEQLTFPRFCRELKVDLAHVPYWASPLSSPVPHVVTIHDLVPILLPAYRGSLLARLYAALAVASARGAQMVLTDSEASRKDIVARLGLAPEKVRAILLAPGPEFTPDAAPNDDTIRAKYNLPEAYVLYLGGFDRRKNLRALLSAWTWVEAGVGESFALVLAGGLPAAGGRVFEDARAVAKELGVENAVKFPGAITPEDLPAVYRGAAAFVYPSRYEGFGLPPLEALACGVPVIACNVSSIPEVVGDAAYLVDPDDARAMGAAILTVLVEEKVAGDLRERGRKQAAKFSWERAARETAEAYRGAV